MQPSLRESLRTAEEFVRAERHVVSLHPSAKPEHRSKAQDKMAEVAAALTADIAAQQLLPSVRKYEQVRSNRQRAIHQTHLGKVAAMLEQFAYLNTTDWALKSGIDRDCDELTETLKILAEQNEAYAGRLTRLLSDILGTSMVNLTFTDLPPVPQYRLNFERSVED